MLDGTSFTSEPQYQRPDNRASELDYVRKEPIVIQPPPVNNIIDYDYDITFPRRFFEKLGRDMLICNRLDFYGNSIPLGSFCFSIAFIIYGFYRCKVYKVNDTFLWSVMLLFGGIGEVTAGFLEFLKGRVFPTVLYLSMGFYFLTHFGLYVIPEWFGLTENMSMLYNYTEGSLCAFFAGWVVICFAILMASMKINVLFTLQCICLLMGMLMRCIGEGTMSLVAKRHASGILLVISGFFSLLVWVSQILNNETFYYQVFPCCPLSPFNEVDLMNTAPIIAAGI